MEYLPLILAAVVAHFLAVVSPGPDFILVTRNSLIYSRRTGFYTAIGIGLGILVHVAYSLIGIGFIIAQSILLFSIIKFIGAAYLIYIGYKAFTAKTSNTKIASEKMVKDLDRWEAFKMGFITNATNPKATLFFLSLFTVLITPQTPLYIKLGLGIEMAIATFVWFAFLSLILSHRLIKGRIAKVQHYAERIMGMILVALGIRLAFASR